MLIILAIIIAVFGFPSNTVSSQNVPRETQPEEEPLPVTFDTLFPLLAEKYGQDTNLAREIIRCESRFDENARNDNYDKKGIYWSSDWGYWQINDYWHVEDAKKLGLDVINNWEDNLEYGFIILKRDGAMAHWSASAHCWNK